MADKQYEFSTRLADLVAQAQISGNKVHESDIKEFFERLMKVSLIIFLHILKLPI